MKSKRLGVTWYFPWVQKLRPRVVFQLKVVVGSLGSCSLPVQCLHPVPAAAGRSSSRRHSLVWSPAAGKTVCWQVLHGPGHCQEPHWDSLVSLYSEGELEEEFV